MKKLLAFTLLMFVCLSNVQSSDAKLTNSKLKTVENLKENKTSALKSNLRKENKLEKITFNKLNKADPPKVIYINALGHEVESPMIVDKAPYKLDRCDQIVALEAEYVPDLQDFTQRKKAYFTITAYHLNRFESKDIAKLDQSLLFSNSRVKPTEPQGAESCLLMDGGDYEKALLLCLKDKEEFDNIRSLLDILQDCRAGKMIGKGQVVQNEVKSDKPALGDVAKKCGLEEGSSFNPDVMLKSSQEKKKEEKSPTGEEEFWVPAGDKVPGAKEKDEKK